MWQIIPENKPGLDFPTFKKLSFTYLHGKLQDDAGYDIYLFDNCELETDGVFFIDHKKMEDGKYPCQYNDKPCTLYFWHDKSERPHGLVVYDDDLEFVEEAESKLTEKPFFT